MGGLSNCHNVPCMFIFSPLSIYESNPCIDKSQHCVFISLSSSRRTYFKRCVSVVNMRSTIKWLLSENHGGIILCDM
jgi:hypothetical protein